MFQGQRRENKNKIKRRVVKQDGMGWERDNIFLE